MEQIDPRILTEHPLLPDRATSDGTHRRLLEEALLRFGERGYHGVSVREIAKAAGVQASSLYTHVESKEQVLFELMLLGHEEHHERLRSVLLESSADPAEQIQRLVTAHVVFHATFPLLARICNRELAALGPENRGQVVAVRNQSEQLFIDVIDRGVRLEVFNVPDAWLATAAIAAMGLRVPEWWNDDLPFNIDEVAGAYRLFALRLLRDPSAGALPAG
ncbi:MAG: TetR/AcrR family transcriptional regulator [Acidimicrobiales bacterium]|jgi:AcrR family transcriptional regulator